MNADVRHDGDASALPAEHFDADVAVLYGFATVLRRTLTPQSAEDRDARGARPGRRLVAPESPASRGGRWKTAFAQVGDHDLPGRRTAASGHVRSQAVRAARNRRT